MTTAEIVKTYLSRRTKFRTWVRAHPAGAYVGSARALGDCPIGRFVHEMTGIAPMVGYKLFDTSIADEGAILPPWVWRVESRVDDERRWGVLITREEMLAILDKA